MRERIFPLQGSHATTRRPQILLCAPSNGAIDENLSRLLELRGALREMGGLRAIRVGQLESIQTKVKPYSLDNIIRTNIENSKCAVYVLLISFIVSVIETLNFVWF